MTDIVMVDVGVDILAGVEVIIWSIAVVVLEFTAALSYVVDVSAGILCSGAAIDVDAVIGARVGFVVDVSITGFADVIICAVPDVGIDALTDVLTVATAVLKFIMPTPLTDSVPSC